MRLRAIRRTPVLLCARVVVCGFVATACASQMPPDRVENLLAQTLHAAETYHASDKDSEAALLLDAVASVDQRYPGVVELDGRLNPAARVGIERGLFGMNHRIRPQLERSAVQRGLLWLPDRLLDLMDVLTFGIHLGPGAFADSHFTRAVQVSGGFRATGGIGLHDHRSFGLKSQSEAGLSVLAIGTQTYAGGLVGTSGVWSGTSSMIGLHDPRMRLYQEMRDYWAIGGSATVAFIGLELDVHPLQLADFFAGLLTIDFLNDDFAHTRGLELDAMEQQLLVEIAKVHRSKHVLEAYFAMRNERDSLQGAEAEAPALEPAPDSTLDPVPAKAAPVDPETHP